MTDYDVNDYEKYIKYKSKYMKLRNLKQSGGVSVVITPTNKMYPSFNFDFTNDTSKADIITAIRSIIFDKTNKIMVTIGSDKHREMSVLFYDYQSSNQKISSLGIREENIVSDEIVFLYNVLYDIHTDPHPIRQSILICQIR